MNNYEKKFKQFLTENKEPISEDKSFLDMRTDIEKALGMELETGFRTDLADRLEKEGISAMDIIQAMSDDDVLVAAHGLMRDYDLFNNSDDIEESEEVKESEQIQENYDDKATEAVQFAVDNDEILYNGIRNEQDIQKAMELIKQSIMSREDLMNIVATEIINSADLASIVRDTQE